MLVGYWKKFINSIEFITPLIIFGLVIEYFGLKGFTAFIVIGILFAIYRAWKFRKNIMDTLRSIETIIWGKPLEKSYWNKGELKNTKVKIIWKKKKSKKN